MRPLLIALGVAMILMGGLWTLQGLNVITGSAMSDKATWAIIGPILAGLGVALVIVAARRRA
ncbi:hypothetical protein GCM10023339_05540 [Alloalcanivorax gelatiniphagus]